MQHRRLSLSTAVAAGRMKGMDKLFLCAWLLAAGFCAVVQSSSSSSSDGCSSCPLTYAPVVDADTGLPFYNDCVAKCQLGPGAKLIAAGSRHGGTTEAGRRRASEVSEEPDFFKLVPAPTRTDAGGEVTADTIKRFANDGYIYVGRTGFIERPEEPAPIGDAKNGTNTAARARASDGNQGGSDSGGPTVSLRMVYPDGDMYMKVWNRSELKSLVKKHTGPKSETAPLSSATVPQVAGRDSSPQSLSRRLLASSIIYSPDDRTEITSLTYPYTAVTLVSGGCTGAMVGSTGRLVLTAAQCVYNNGVNPDAPVGFYSNLQVAPGVYSGGIFNYGAHSTGIAQVQTTWTQGSWDANIALLQLSYHYKACGSLGYGYQCGSSEYSLTTAGYPGDKPSYTMWWQTATVTTDVCTGSAETLFPFDAADGQVGSPFWEASDNTVRFVLSRGACCSGNVAVAITPAFYSIMNDFTSNYILTTPTYILVGGPNRKVFVHCDTTSWVCKGTTTRTSATRFYGHPVSSSNKAALRVPGTSLCLSLRSTRSIGKVNLYPCDITSFSFNSTELWNIGTYNNIPVLRTDNGGFLSWGGSGVQMKTASICSPSKASSCTWRVETA